MKRLIVLPLLLLTACSPKPADVVDRYLKAVQSGDVKEQSKILCAEGAVEKSPIKNAPSWTIVGQESRTAEPNFRYQLVTAKIGDRTFAIEVWKSDDLFKQQQSAIKRLQDKGVPFKDLTPNRSQWSSEEFCVDVQDG